MSKLFEPLVVGDLVLPNRIIMAPLTRNRATMPGRVPNTLMRDYYVQRASAGLIISEATSVEPMGVGYPSTPGIWSPEQTEGWKAVTNGVHEAGGRIFMQLWHVGRVSHSMYHDGALPVAPTALAPEGHVSLTRPEKPYEIPRALDAAEIPGIVAAFRKGAENAKAAGFDGVEIHGANGYLLDQFLQDGSNRRTDRYGGPVENRARLHLEVTDAVVSVWGPARVGMHVAPRADAHTMGDSNRAATFGYLVGELAQRRIAFICAREARAEDSLGPQLRKTFGGVWIANERFNKETAEQAIASGEADAVAFGKAFIANPDLPRRFAENAALNRWDVQTFYSQGPQGYTDYPLAA
ncbi:MAG: alkene reductase [Hyphomicrobiaceae bacterium]|nr:MAG: alkene reductase [Hyphomicrobiaceae bacterium]